MREEVLLAMVLYLLFMLVPAIPACMIYKLFPESKTDVSGPFYGMKLKAGGAFAAYLIVAILGFFLVNKIHDQIIDLEPKTWTISGTATVIDSDDHALITIKAMPPPSQIATDEEGKFWLPNVEISEDDNSYMGEIRIEKRGYHTITETFDESNSFIDRENRVIVLSEPLELTPRSNGP